MQKMDLIIGSYLSRIIYRYIMRANTHALLLPCIKEVYLRDWVADSELFSCGNVLFCSSNDQVVLDECEVFSSITGCTSERHYYIIAAP